MNNKEKGYLGEELAAEYLRSLGYEIIEQNYTVRGGEIDIIAIDDGTLVIVEVKSRTACVDGERPSEALDERKIRFLVRSADRYVFEKRDLCSDMPLRFDCVEVIFNGDGNGKPQIIHSKDFDAWIEIKPGDPYEYYF